LSNARREFAEWSQLRDTAEAEVARARRAAVQAIGEQTVSEYEEFRRRRNAATDTVDAKAYSLAEGALRERMRQYAEVLDRTRAPARGRVYLLVAVPDDPDGRLVLLSPVAPADIEADDDLRWRVAAFLFDVAERSARELGATVTIGESLGSLAVDLRPWAAEAELIEIALREAWEGRPTLSNALNLAWEPAPGIDPPFAALTDQGDERQRAASGPPVGGALRSVARRLGLTLDDLVASLSGSGLPFTDDRVEPGVEVSLRQLLHLDVSRREDIGSAQAAEVGAPVGLPDSTIPEMVARRILMKLLRDDRIGSRQTDGKNVWGHHFADNEKDLAREVTRRLIQSGLLMKGKAGRDRLSIDPRRIGDVHAIIDHRWKDSALFEGLA
jgi:hypothetical protein